MSMESLSKRIKTTQDLRGIVSTMKSLSSVSLVQYEKAQQSLTGYTQTLREAFHALVKTNSIRPPKKTPVAKDKTLVIIVGSDNGLVGRFNKDIVHSAITQANTFMTIGKRAAVFAENEKLHLVAKYAMPNSVKAVHSVASTVIIKIEEILSRLHLTRVDVLFYKRLPNEPVHIETLHLLPFSLDQYLRLKDEKWPTNNVPLITLNADVMMSKLIQEYLMIALSSAMIMSLSAEHYTRMVNMQAAQKNIDESLDEMNLAFSRLRQEAITEELIDVISGAEALKKKK